MVVATVTNAARWPSSSLRSQIVLDLEPPSAAAHDTQNQWCVAPSDADAANAVWLLVSGACGGGRDAGGAKLGGDGKRIVGSGAVLFSKDLT